MTTTNQQNNNMDFLGNVISSYQNNHDTNWSSYAVVMQLDSRGMITKHRVPTITNEFFNPATLGESNKG